MEGENSITFLDICTTFLKPYFFAQLFYSFCIKPKFLIEIPVFSLHNQNYGDVDKSPNPLL